MTHLNINQALGCVTCEQSLNKVKPVKFIQNSEDGWLFLCGDACHTNESCSKDKFVAIHIHHLIAYDPSLYEVFIKLETGFEATKVGDGTWQIEKSSDSMR